MSWPTVALGEVATFVRGVTFKPEDVAPPDGNGTVACMRTKNVQEYLDTTDVWGIPRRHVKRSDQYLIGGDTLVSSANSWNLVGKCCFVPQLDAAATFGGFITALRAEHSRLEPRYLFRWFSSPRVQQLVRSFGRRTTSISNLDLSQCRKLRIPLPPLAEQRRIARALDAADALRIKRREAIAHATTLVQADFDETFGVRATTTPLSDLVMPNRPITYGILKPGDDVPDGVPYVRVVDLQEGAIRVESLRRTSPRIAAEYKRSTLAAGDLVMSIRGHVGRLAIVPPSLVGANITQDSARLAVCGYDPRYVLESIRSTAAQRWMARRVKGVAVSGINLADVKLIPIPNASRDAQLEFAARAAGADRVVESAREHLVQLDSLFASLQHRAFTGAL